MFPQSYLLDILRNVRYAISVERAKFTNEWKQKNPPSTSDPGAKGGSYGSGQQRVGNRSLQGMGQAVTTPRRNYGQAQGYGVGASRVNMDQAHHKGDGGGTPLKGGSTKGDMRIMVGPHRRVDSSLPGGTCPETGAQVGKTNVTQR